MIQMKGGHQFFSWHIRNTWSSCDSNRYNSFIFSFEFLKTFIGKFIKYKMSGVKEQERMIHLIDLCHVFFQHYINRSLMEGFSGSYQINVTYHLETSMTSAIVLKFQMIKFHLSVFFSSSNAYHSHMPSIQSKFDCILYILFVCECFARRKSSTQKFLAITRLFVFYFTIDESILFHVSVSDKLLFRLENTW